MGVLCGFRETSDPGEETPAAEALWCNRCVPIRMGGLCIDRVEECAEGLDVCVHVTITYPHPSSNSYFKRCSRRFVADNMRRSQHLTVHICETDFCN
ncbi:Hypothetical predicted protein [Xyrichtys novacula]|uniref:UPAR/Ly6 domain-containing protein n=1 Tax=Xyrichtys novacula TaxID=13765 RepID=A0AAV1HM69_XYRNO|nr:Hypothetical predicted protein [Xyrichtys novacula]